MSDTLVEILNELRTLNATMARLEDRLTTARPVARVKEAPERFVYVGAMLSIWYAKVGSAHLTTREARELGLPRFPTGSLTAIARTLHDWSENPWRALGENQVYRLRRSIRHNQRVWSVERA